jgi:hypothetical protein
MICASFVFISPDEKIPGLYYLFFASRSFGQNSVDTSLFNISMATRLAQMPLNA